MDINMTNEHIFVDEILDNKMGNCRETPSHKIKEEFLDSCDGSEQEFAGQEPAIVSSDDIISKVKEEDDEILMKEEIKEEDLEHQSSFNDEIKECLNFHNKKLATKVTNQTKMHSIQMASRGCLHPADAFCYVCGQFIKTRARKYSVKVCRKMCEAYKAYFGIPVGDQDKPWAPHFTCEYCKKTLEGWYRGEKRAMKFAIPRIWQQPTNHSSNCYFCMVDPTKRRSGKNAPKIVYPDISSSTAPVPHCPYLPVPTPPKWDQQSSGNSSEEDIGDPDYGFTDADQERRRYFPNQKDVNDLIKDLGLTKSNAELLTSRLKRWNLLNESV